MVSKPLQKGGGVVMKLAEESGMVKKVLKAIDAPGRNGNYPSWETVRRRLNKQEAEVNPGAYSAESLERMQQGKNPLDKSGESMDWHHINGRTGTSPHRRDNLEPLRKEEHKEKHRGGQAKK